MLLVGIDVAKNKHDCYIMDTEGVLYQDSLCIENSKIGFHSLIQSIDCALGTKDRTNVRIGLESTGHYSANILNFLLSHGFQVNLFNPLSTNLFRKAHTLRKTKTDKTDAKWIASMLFSEDSKSYSPMSYQISELKSLTRHRYRMVGHQSRLKISISRLIDLIFPELPALVWSIHQASSYAMLLELPSPEDISKCHLTRLTNLLLKASKGKYGREKAIAFRNAASSSIGSSSSSLRLELQQTIRLVKSVQSEIDILDAQIKRMMQDINSPIMSIPGISFILGAIILSEIGNIELFSSASKLLAFAGMEPSIYQSGKFHASNTPMVKRGSSYLRWAIMQAARLVSMRDLTFKNYLCKKQEQGKHYYVALSHVGKKLVRLIHSLLKNHCSYIPQY